MRLVSSKESANWLGNVILTKNLVRLRTLQLSDGIMKELQFTVEVTMMQIELEAATCS